jgi:hypothetical protein
VRKLITTLLVLAVLLVAADRISVRVVDDVVAQRMQEDGGLQDRPDVDIRGIPFLTQALRGRYEDVRVRIDDVTRNGVTVSRPDVQISGVQLPLSKVRHANAVPVTGLHATALVSYVELATESGLAGVTISPAGDKVKVTGKVAGVAASVTSTVRLDGNRLVVSTGGVLDFSVRLPVLPYGLRLTSAQAGPDGVVLTAESGPTVLAPQ